MDKQSELDELTNDLMAVSGKPVVGIVEAAELTDRSTTTLRRAVWRGELAASRAAANGPLTFRLRALARWLLNGEARALPINKAMQRKAAKAGGGAE